MLPQLTPAQETRLWSRVTKTDACWLWTGSVDSRRGYGVMAVAGVPHATYRLVYECLHGPIAPGVRLVRRCASPRCVNPDHFEPVAFSGRTLAERFWAKVEKTATCWLWTGSQRGNGYGEINVDGKSQAAHRVAFLLSGGVIPAGMELDHLCRVRLCVNPAHLEPVSRQVNNLRGTGNGHRGKTHCVYGHSLENAYRTKDGRRHCRECLHRREHAYRRRRLEAKRAAMADLAFSDTARGEERASPVPVSMNDPRYPPRQGQAHG